MVLWRGGLALGGRFARSGASLVDFCVCARVGAGLRPIGERCVLNFMYVHDSRALGLVFALQKGLMSVISVVRW